jgi:hypothetical protein
MDTVAPVPKPRGSPLEQKHSKCKMPGTSSKKPVPLPRLKIFDESDCRPGEINSEDSVVSERQTCTITSHVSENSGSTQCNKRIVPQYLKQEWEIECDDQSKGKSVLGRTKNVSASIEKSVRNMIARRLTVRATPPNKVNDNSVIKIGRSQSLPSGDIFQSISFHSPLSVENASQEVIVSKDTIEEDCIPTSGAPPPVYPPPPLPDESVYDEVHSVVSSQSSSFELYCDSNISNCETVYEDISLIRENSGHMLPDPSHEVTKGNALESCDSPVESQHQYALRSDSWSFYDTAPEKDIYQTVAPSDISSFNDSDSLIYNRPCGSKFSGTESICSLSLPGDLNCENSDEISEGEPCANSSMQLGRQQSVNIHNDFYENWETNIPVRRAEESRKVLTKSVILEFDPLYENADGSGETNANCTDYLLLADTCETVSQYGKIKRLVTSKVPECKTGEKGDFVCPPVPPRRYDSITAITTEGSSVIVEPGKENVPKVVPLTNNDGNSQNSPQEKAESGFTGDSNDVSADGLLGRNRKAALVRWASMKRAIQFMAEGSSFRKMTREQVGIEAKHDTQNTVFYKGQGEASPPVKRPNLTCRAAIIHSGLLYRSASGCKDFMPRHCIFAEGKLSCFTDKSSTSLSEVIPLDGLLSIQFVPEHKAG